MWIWIIIAAIVIGAIIGFLGSDENSGGEGAAQGAMAGGCMAVGCLARIAIAGLSILLILWIFDCLFG